MGNVGPNIWPLSKLRNDALKARIFNSDRYGEVQNSGSPVTSRKRGFSLLIFIVTFTSGLAAAFIY